jgi:hypothetical protein
MTGPSAVPRPSIVTTDYDQQSRLETINSFPSSWRPLPYDLEAATSCVLAVLTV